MFKSMLEGIWQCDGCGQTYAEYVNGCVRDHLAPRGVNLAYPEPPLAEPPRHDIQETDQ